MILLEGGLRRAVEPLAFSPDSAHLAGSGGNRIRAEVWDVGTGKHIWTGRERSYYLKENLQVDLAGRWFFAAGGLDGLYAIDSRTGAATRIGGRRPQDTFAVSQAEDCIAFFDASQRQFLAFDLTPKGIGRQRWSKPMGTRRVAEVWRSGGMTFFPDGDKFASAEYRNDPYGRPDIWIRIRSAKDGSILDKIRPDCSFPQQVVVSPDGVWVALWAGRSLLIFHMTDPGNSVKLTSPNRQYLTGIAFHPGGRYLAATSNDATVRMHDRDAGWEVTKTYDWNIGKLKSVAFSPDGNLAAAGSDTGKVVVWDVDL